jgi:nucleotide-binding universal stress UspA family protein
MGLSYIIDIPDGGGTMIDHILVPLDGSSLAERVLPHLLAVAHSFESRVTLLRVMSGDHSEGIGRRIDPLDWQMRDAEARAYLNRMAENLSEPKMNVDHILLEGEPATRILEYAHNKNVDLIILSSHGVSGLTSWNISSIVHKTVNRVHKPIMIVRAHQILPEDVKVVEYNRLLVPLDGSHRAECVLPMAARLAEYHQAELILAHVVRRPEVPRRGPPSPEDIELAKELVERNQTEAEHYLRQIKRRFSGDLNSHLIVGEDVADALHNLVEQEKPDLVVMSAHGYSGSTQWPYGSLALNFIAYGTTPLVIVQDLHDEFEPLPPALKGASQEQQGQ